MSKPEGRDRMQWLGSRRVRVALLAAALAALVAACGGSSSSNQTKGVTINVTLAINPPPKSALDEFTKETGIKVRWTNIDWDSLQTKIAAAATSHTYFADATDVDWSRVGEFAKTRWFRPLDQYMNTKAMAPDMPQLGAFTVGGKAIGIPYDASFLVATVNRKMLSKAGVGRLPTTIGEYTAALRKVKSAGVAQYPLNIPLAAAEGLSTYWYQTTEAFGGTVLGRGYAPQFTSPGSPGYKAMQWMIDAVKQGLVPPGNVNTTDSQGQQNLMAKGKVASTFGDYSGNVGTLYDVKSASTVTGQVSYLRTPGVTGPAGNVDNPDGIGIPVDAKYPQAAAKFIQWFTSSHKQADFAGANGDQNVMQGYSFPSRLSAFKTLVKSGKVPEGDRLFTLLSTRARPAFPQGIPPWYGQFSNAVYTNIHDAATGHRSVASAIAAIAQTVNRLRGGS
jgi:multiple sugar transport system substrate-binding protein